SPRRTHVEPARSSAVARPCHVRIGMFPRVIRIAVAGAGPALPWLCYAGAGRRPWPRRGGSVAPFAQQSEQTTGRGLMEHQYKVDLMRRNLLLGSAALGVVACIPPVFAASGGITATINPAATRPPISPMIYGGFIEHIGNLINHSLWSETLDDRKFYYGVLAERPRKPDDRRGAMEI